MKKKVAIIGYGGQGAWHGDHILKSDVTELAGVYDIRDTRKDVAREKDIKVYSSCEEIFADKTVDIVVVATPNDIHEELSVKALNSGKHVVCEKPVTLSVESFDRIVDAAKKNNRIFSVHQNRRWDVDYLAMKRVHDSGEIGEIINLESRIHGSRGIPSDWRGIKKYGGGMLYDWGVHLIDQALMILGFDVESVRCEFEHTTNEEVDDGFYLNIYFKSGKKAFIEVATYNFIAMPRFYMRGKQGTAYISDWRENCKVAKLKAWNEKEVIPVLTAAGITKTMAPRDEITIDEYAVEKPVSDVHDFYRNFVSAVEGTEKQFVKLEQSRVVLQVISAAFESVENNGNKVCLR